MSSGRAGRFARGALLALAAIGWAAARAEPGAKEVRSELRVRVGDKAPDFALVANDGKTIKLSTYAGRAVLLDFYRAYW
jgi:cytochrome oxidase Cu insertion factor (SCO1/SenC/PrrC family)